MKSTVNDLDSILYLECTECEYQITFGLKLYTMSLLIILVVYFRDYILY